MRPYARQVCCAGKNPMCWVFVDMIPEIWCTPGTSLPESGPVFSLLQSVWIFLSEPHSRRTFFENHFSTMRFLYGASSLPAIGMAYALSHFSRNQPFQRVCAPFQNWCGALCGERYRFSGFWTITHISISTRTHPYWRSSSTSSSSHISKSTWDMLCRLIQSVCCSMMVWLLLFVDITDW